MLLSLTEMVCGGERRGENPKVTRNVKKREGKLVIPVGFHTVQKRRQRRSVENCAVTLRLKIIYIMVQKGEILDFHYNTNNETKPGNYCLPHPSRAV